MNTFLARWFADKNGDSPLSPESYGLPKPLRDPHDVEGRKWFRRALIALCIAGYIMILMPQELRGHLRFLKTTVALPTPALVSEICAEIKIIGLKNGPIIWYDCVKKFSDGTAFRRIGDAKP